MKPLDNEALRAILTEPKNAIIKQYSKLFEMDQIKLTFTDEALDHIVTQAVEYALGARGLRSLCETILTDAMFDLPGSETLELEVDLAFVQQHLSPDTLSTLRAVS